ncbi:MAG TPA: hypothetical protein VIH45_06585 [Desulfuromonadaceae bacterium]
MRKGVRIFSAVLVMAWCAACGNNVTNPTKTSFQNYSSLTPPIPPVMGGSVQGTQLPLAFKNITSVTVSTIAGTAGSSGSSDGGSTTVRFGLANGITADGKNLFIADFSNNTIRKYSFSNHSTTTIAGIGGVASSNPVLNTDSSLFSAFGSSAGGAGNAYFNGPSGITTTDGKNLYVADQNNSTIRKIAIAFRNSSTVVTTIAGVPGSLGSVDDPVGVNARFNHPTDITTDGTNLYVTDSGNLTIRKIGLTPPYPVWTIAGSPGVSGANPLFPSTVSGSDARFQYPARITTDGKNLYVTDFVKNTVSMIAVKQNGQSKSNVVSTIAGTPVFGSTPGVSGSTDGIGGAASFSKINGITSDGTNLYVTDCNNNTIRRLTPDGSGNWTVYTIAGTAHLIKTDPTKTDSYKDGKGPAAQFKFPVGITTDGTSLYVTDSNNYVIRKIQ